MKFLIRALMVLHMMNCSAVFAAEEVYITPSDQWENRLNALNPGDTAILEAGTYIPAADNPTIRLMGNKSEPITIRGAGHLEAIIDGDGTDKHPLRIEDSSYLIIENIVFTNLVDGLDRFSGVDDPDDPDNLAIEDRDGSNTYLSGNNDQYNGITIAGSDHITIRKNYFRDITSRGIFPTGAPSAESRVGVDDILIEENIFVDIGDDTGAGDIVLSFNVTNWTIRNNLFAGNVDGVVKAGLGTSGLIENNIFVYHRWEDAIDIKSHYSSSLGEDSESIIRNNVIYAADVKFTGISIQNSSQNVSVINNLIYGTGNEAAILIRGRCDENWVLMNPDDYSGPKTCSIPVKNIKVVGNWLDGSYQGQRLHVVDDLGSNGEGFDIKQTDVPTNVEDVYFLHNVVLNYDKATFFNYQESYLEKTGAVSYQNPTGYFNVNFNNNIVNSILDEAYVDSIDLFATNNLYWNLANDDICDANSSDTATDLNCINDENPIFAIPEFEIVPGVLGVGSVGKEQAYILPMHDYGNDVGLPLSNVSLASLEENILAKLESVFTPDEIKIAMNRGAVLYPYHVQENSSPSLVVQAESAGLITDDDTAGLVWTIENEVAAANGRSLRAQGSSTTNGEEESVAAYRLKFTNNLINTYTLYARVRNNEVGVDSGNSFWYSLFDSAPDGQVSFDTTAKYHWIKLGLYTPNLNKDHELKLGVRENGAFVDVLVFHENDNLLTDIPLLDQLSGVPDQDRDGIRDSSDEVALDLFLPNGEGLNLAIDDQYQQPSTGYTHTDTLHILAWSGAVGPEAHKHTYSITDNSGSPLANGELIIGNDDGSYEAHIPLSSPGLNGYSGEAQISVFLQLKGNKYMSPKKKFTIF